MKPQLMIVLFVLLAGCQSVAGTADLFLCPSCPEAGGSGGGDAGGAGAGGSDVGGGDVGGGKACAEGEHTVTVNAPSDVTISLDANDMVVAGPVCLATGSQTLKARCADGNADVDWGNDLCPSVDKDCTFMLSEDETFTITLVACN